MTESTTALIRRIEAAFGNVPFPGADHLTDSTYGEEPAALVEDFRDKTDWRTLTAEFLDQAPQGWGTALSFFSPEALCFYLPAYLIADLRDELTGGSDPAFILSHSVTPAAEGQKIARVWGGGSMADHGRRRFDPFSDAQAAAVVDYLRWKLDRLGGYDPTIEQALMHYWLPRVEGA